jgi:nucleoside-diphosphate-sugar epimerase
LKYFITGATGFIGGRIARQLRDAGHEVVALARTPSKAGDLLELGVQVHEGDITDRESMRAPMTGVDGVFHIAAWYKIGAKDRKVAEQINVEGTRNVLELMRELAIPRGVYTSSLAVFSDTKGQAVDERYRHEGPWLSEYDRTKWVAHYKVAAPMIEQGLPLIIVQPGLVYGPGDTSAMHNTWVQYLTGKLPVVPKGTAYCWGHVDDTARGHIQAMEKGKPGESYIIAGPAHSLADALQLAAKISGVRPPRMQAPPAMLKAMATLLWPLSKVVTLPEAYHPETLRVVAGVTYLGTSARAKRELGFNPLPLEQGLPATLDWEMAQLGMAPPRRSS